MAHHPFKTIVASSHAALLDALRSTICTAADAAIAARGVFHLATSGGSFPGTFGEALKAAAPGIDTSRWHIWYADERVVPLSSADSTHAAYEAAYYWGGAPGGWEGEAHPIDYAAYEGAGGGEAGLRAVAAAYENAIVEHLGWDAAAGCPVFDLMILGIGPDGHTASLFPGHALLTTPPSAWETSSEDGGSLPPPHAHARPALRGASPAAPVVTFISDSPKPPPQRVTLTLGAINAARDVLVVVTGGNKAETVAAVFAQAAAGLTPDTPGVLPSALVRQVGGDGRPVWLLDAPAAAALPAAASQ